jgi:alpha-galactosidase
MKQRRACRYFGLCSLLCAAALVAGLALLVVALSAPVSHAGARGGQPAGPAEPAVILTPKPPPTPRINGARVFGVRPGRPFLFTIAASGDRPMKFSAENLPSGLSVNEDNGVISGTAPAAKGEHLVTVRATNALGKAERALKIVVGDRIGLTPAMGWNSWNVFGNQVTGERVRQQADAMVKSGLMNHGWVYINIDDCWQTRTTGGRGRAPVGPAPGQVQGDTPGRAPDGTILTNANFPDMKGLADYIHSLGLKAGLYSSPGARTCEDYTGSQGFEEKDAQTWADWGYDYIKYDLCFSYRTPAGVTGREAAIRPYRDMRAALDKVNRDIIYSLCQYGRNNVWEWGDQVGGNSWRTTNDITDTWQSISGIWSAAWANAGAAYAKPGCFNDPDMLVVGRVGWGNPRPNRLTPNEQYTHFSIAPAPGLRSGQPGRVHPQPAHERRSAGRQPGPAGQAGHTSGAERLARGLGQTHGGWLPGRRPVQQG